MTPNKQIKIVLIALFLLIILGGVSLYFYQKNRYNDVFFEYNGFAVHKVDSAGVPIYKVKMFIQDNPQPLLLGFRYNPQELESIEIENNLRDKLIKKQLFISMDPTLSSLATIAYSEIDRITENPFLFNLPTAPGLIREVEGNDLPVINCEDSNQDVAVILFKIGNKDKIYSKDGCIMIESLDEKGLIKGADRLMLTILRIMEA